MKAIKNSCLLFVIMNYTVITSYGQWLPNGATTGNIYYNNGNVGIGISTPVTKLDVNGTIRSAGTIINGGSDFVLAPADGRNQGAANYNRALVHTDWGIGNDNLVINLAGDFEGGVQVQGTKVILDGKVGLGTFTPNAKLHIVHTGAHKDGGNNNLFSGDVLIQANTSSRNPNVGAQLEFAIPANTDGSNPWGQARIITVAGDQNNFSARGKMILGTRRNFSKNGQASEWFYGDDIVIDGVGNVGIGSLSPDHKLTVKGKIHTEEVLVDLNVPGPDYVFESNYNLLPLSEVESYIKRNKHLPEVPSAKEMKENGLNLKEMNLLLLKKVEELTLHLIEQQKLIQQQSYRIENLENKKP